MPQPIIERERAEAARADSTGKLLVTVLTPGRGSSGYYSEAVVKEAAEAGLIHAGTPMYLDHISETERYDRPGRSVKDIAAKFTGPSFWNATEKAMQAPAELIPGPYRDAMVALQESIGVSVNGSATDIVNGTVEGHTGKIVEGLAEIGSVDFVTRAGRGGKFTTLLESARLEEAVLTVSEATADDRMGHLRDAVRAAHGSDRTSAWVRDQDAEATTVYFDVHDHRGDQPTKTYAQGYKVGKNDVDVTLTGDPTEVKPVTKYVTATRPDTQHNPATESKEDTMPKKEIEESEYNRLTESAGRVATLESERDTEKARADAAEQTLAERDRRDDAVKLLAEKATEAKVQFTLLEQRGILADLPVTDDKLDVDKFTATVEAAVAEKKPAPVQRNGVTGFGAAAGTTTSGVVSEAAPTHSPWGRPLTEQRGA